MTLNFSRLHHQRPGYGYAGVPDPWLHVPEPRDDGIYQMDLETGAQRLVIPTALLAETRRKPTMDGAVHRFNHLQFSPDGPRFIFLHRWRPRRATYEGTSPASVPPARTARRSPSWPTRTSSRTSTGATRSTSWPGPATGGWTRSGCSPIPLAPPAGRLRRRSWAGRRCPGTGTAATPRTGPGAGSPTTPTRTPSSGARSMSLIRRRGRRTDLGRFYSPPELDAGLPGRPAPALEPGRAPDLLRLGARGLAPALRRGRPGLKTQPPPPAPGLLSWCGPWYRS